MAQSAVIGDGPVRFTRKNGSMILVPLSQLYFDDAGVLTRDPLAPPEAPELLDFLNFLVLSGQLSKADSPPPQAALLIKAAGMGTDYNGVTIDIEAISGTDPTKLTFNATVSKTEVYTGLIWDPASSADPNYYQNVLGTELGPGTASSIIRALSTDTPTAPAEIPTPGAPFTDNGKNNKASLAVPTSDPKVAAFNLQAFKAGSSGSLTTILISNVKKATFDMTVTWTKPLTGKKISEFEADSDCAFLIKVSDPPSGPGIPRAGVVALMGAIDATAAGATVFTP